MQATSSKGLINLSNTACEPRSDEKLRQLPGAPWDREGPPGGFYGTPMGFQWKSTSFHRQINDNQWISIENPSIFIVNHGKSMDFQCNPIGFRWESNGNQWGLLWKAMKPHRQSTHWDPCKSIGNPWKAIGNPLKPIGDPSKSTGAPLKPMGDQ